LCAIAGVLTIALPVPIVVSHFQFFYASNEVVKKLNKETLKLSFRRDSEISRENLEKSAIKIITNNDSTATTNQHSSVKKNSNKTNILFKCFKSKTADNGS
jgi:uncharacterized GH25 family protein